MWLEALTTKLVNNPMNIFFIKPNSILEHAFSLNIYGHR